MVSVLGTLSTYYPQFVDHPPKILIFIPRVWYASHISGRASAIRATQDWRKLVGEVSGLVARNVARSAETEDVKMAPYFIAAQLYWGINHIRDINNLAHGNNRVSWVVLLFMHRRHFIGQDVLVSAILDSKVHRRRAYQPAEQHSPKRGRDIAIGGEDGSVP
ncbi:hypothetical protein G5I_04298 [Acromyrmex echinatior]|uniref:Uncharacterized protein n=1 Tax=Acromyrmex echinatior TaxID=103372 RepID=F4WF91_ACREC|nr:hypothetical protein G5I_04298 [Acromyrmex echinatior]